MGRSTIPSTDGGLLQFAQAFSTQITASAASFGLSAGQASSYATSFSNYQTALNVATNDSTRTKGTVADKNSKKQTLRDATMQLANVVRMHPGITDLQLEDLGLNVPDRNPSPVPPPTKAPLVTVVSVVARTARYKLVDADFPNSRRRPPNAIGATILSYVGTTPPPSNDPGWVLEGQTGRTTFAVTFPDSVQPGEPCWVTALWYTQRGLYSPACTPLQTFLQIGPAQQTA